MLSYTIDGSLLTLNASSTPTLDERENVFNAMRADPAVPNGAQLLIDAREVDLAMRDFSVAERLGVLVDLVGPKLGPVCAVIIPSGLSPHFRLFQAAGDAVGLQIELFSDEQSARQWLIAHR